VPAPVATTLAGPPADPGVILNDTDSIGLPPGAALAITFLISCS
jgi:hypothetical protein